MKHLSFLICLLFISACQDKKALPTLENKQMEAVTTEFICDLQENIDIIGMVTDCSFIDEHSFWVLTDDNIVKYNTKGEQQIFIAKKGQGPGEYLHPTLIDIHNNVLYVWSAGSTKLITYDLEGNYIREYTNYKKAIKNFIVLDEETVCFYKVNGDNTALLEIYSLKDEKVIQSVVAVTNEDEIRFSVAAKPLMMVDNGKLYFTKPSEIALYQLDLSNYSVSKIFEFTDKDFVVEKIGDVKAIFNDNFLEVLNYLARNSVVTNLLKIGDSFYLRTEIGKYHIDFQKQTTDFSERFVRYYQCDLSNTGVVKAITTPVKEVSPKYVIWNGKSYQLETQANITRLSLLKL